MDNPLFFFFWCGSVDGNKQNNTCYFLQTAHRKDTKSKASSHLRFQKTFCNKYLFSFRQTFPSVCWVTSDSPESPRPHPPPRPIDGECVQNQGKSNRPFVRPSILKHRYSQPPSQTLAPPSFLDFHKAGWHRVGIRSQLQLFSCSDVGRCGRA